MTQGARACAVSPRPHPAMASRAALPGLLLLLLLIAGLRAQDDFDLSDALPDGRDTQPTASPRKPSPGNAGPPKPKPKPDSPGTSGGFSDADLSDVGERRPAAPGAAGGGGGNDEAAAAQPPGLVPGIVGAVAVAAVGAISSFIAYQRRRLCFREGETSTA